MTVLLVSAAVAMEAKMTIDRIDPPDWFAGMRGTSLQLMVYGQNIRSVDSVTTDYPGVRVDSVVHADSPNYLFVYLDIAGADPGVLTLTFADGASVTTADYRLKPRSMAGNARTGFSNADVLYMLMPDRFAQGRPDNAGLPGLRSYVIDRTEPSLRHGGDLEGIRQHLDYLADLGVTVIWLTPVLENDAPDDTVHRTSSYHGYATTDYYRVDPRFGTNDDYKKLVDDAHDKGLKVVMDMIFNHCGFWHPWVKDMPTNDWFNAPEWLADSDGHPDSALTNTAYLQTSYKLTPVLDPYASDIDRKETVEGWFVPSMPDLNQRNPHVIKYLIQNSIWWIETAGIDGIRMDTYPYADAGAMALWMKTIDNEYPFFNTVGETWVTEPAYTAAWQRDAHLTGKDSFLKTVMDFSFFDKINLAKNEETDGWWAGLNRVYNSFVYDYLYPRPENVMAFIENHDTDRFLGNGRDTLALKQALALLLTVNRIPQLYYGTEVLMNGTKDITDGNVRNDFPGGFPGDTRSAFNANGRTRAQNSMFNWLRRLLHWRKGNGTIVHGTMTQFIPYNGVYVVARQRNGNTVLTVLNGTNSNATLRVTRYREVIGNTSKAKDILTGHYVDLSQDVKLKPRQTLILDF